MILKELFYFNNNKAEEMSQDDRYDPKNDDSVVDKKDTRKIRLTLKQINHLRRASDMHSVERVKEMEFISKMYAAPAPDAAA